MGAILDQQPDGGFIRFSVKEFGEKWCVYGHSISRLPNDYFYIGICKLRDLYDFTDAYKNSYWRQNVKDDTVISIRVIATMDNPHDAQRAASHVYRTFRPVANVHGHQVNGRILITCVQGDNAGVTYETAAQAAKMNGLTAGAMSNHLNNRVGYETLRGMKFKRGM